MKKKILSLLMSFCLIIGSLFSLAGCSTVKTDSTKENKGEVVKVGDVTLTKADIINSFYTYYQSNSSYFSYYDEETIANSFYTWAVMKQIINTEAFSSLYNPETNPNGKIVYSKKAEEEVWESVYDYIYSQVSTYEKAIYTLNGTETKDLPLWLQTEETEESAATKFESYTSLKPEIEVQDPNEHADKMSDETIKKTKVADLEAYLFKYASSQDEEGEDILSEISGEELQIRNQAYAKYIEGLASNAKAAGKSTEKVDLMNAEVIRVYKAYYDSKITSIFQNYYLKNQLIDTENGDKVSLGDRAVVEAYLDKYFSDVQAYQAEDGYIATMTNSDGASLVLYNYKGRNFYFTVQHILVKFDDYITKEIQKLDGYTASNDYDKVVSDIFKQQRQKLADSYLMLTAVNETSAEQLKSIDVVGDYYFYDAELAGVAPHYGYIKVVKNVDVDEKVTYTRTDNSEEVDADDVKRMATSDEVIECYTDNLVKWVDLCNRYILLADAAEDESLLPSELVVKEKELSDFVEQYEDMEYVFKVARDMKSFGKSADEIRKKVASLLFVELEWIYSSDSLDNKLSNKMGYVMSNYKDDNGSWVSEFAAGAREILKSVQANDGNNALINSTNKVISQFGCHIIKIEDIFVSGESLIDMSDFDEFDLDDPEFVEAMIEEMKSTYVCGASNQTIYDYFYDELYKVYAGDDSSTSGSYFVNVQYKLLSQYYKDGKINYIEKMTYNELMDSIA